MTEVASPSTAWQDAPHTAGEHARMSASSGWLDPEGALMETALEGDAAAGGGTVRLRPPSGRAVAGS